MLYGAGMNEPRKSERKMWRISNIVWFLVKAAGAGIISYATPRLLVSVGVPLDEWIVTVGGSLQLNSEMALWAATVAIGAVLFLGDRFWHHRYRHIHHKELQVETMPEASLQMEVIRGAHSSPEHSAGIGSKAHDLPPRQTVWDAVEDRQQGSFLRHLIDAKSKSVAEAALKPKRDIPLGHAVAYACLGTWDRLEELPKLIKEDGLLVEKLREFEQKAGDGDLAVWGKDRDDDGSGWDAIHVLVPTAHWPTHWVQPASLTGRANTISRPQHDDDGVRFYDLMVDRRQIARAFPKSAAPSHVSPPPPTQPNASRPRMGTPGAYVWGLDGPQTVVGIELHNFGSSTAQNVRARSLCSMLPRYPSPPIEFDKSNFLGPCEPGHTQNIRYPFPTPISSAQVSQFDRDGGLSIYLLLEVDYEDESGKRYRREIAYYLDPLAERHDKGLVMSVCGEANNREVEVTED